MSEKSFLNNLNIPANNYFGSEGGADQTEPETPKAEKRPAPAKVKRAADQETKSKRLNLLIKPSTYADLNKIAAMQQISLNELINTLCEKQIQSKKGQETIEKYNQVFNK